MIPGQPLSILVLGASYSLLPTVKIAAAGHAVTLVARQAECEAIERDGVEIFVPAREDGRILRLAVPASIGTAVLPGAIGLVEPTAAEPERHDLALLAMSEPHYADPVVDALMARLAASGRPCLSIMNMPPLAFLARLPDLDTKGLRDAYSAPDVWAQFDPDLMSLASPDPQALRLDPDRPGSLTVTLPSNFKFAPFADPRLQSMLERLAATVNAAMHSTPQGPSASRVRFIAHPSLHVPLAKWPMLIAGNCRCVREGAPVSIREAVHTDRAESRLIYEVVQQLAYRLGAAQSDLVTFDRYADAALSLTRPSAMARALAAGARQVERPDRLVKALCQDKGLDLPALDAVTARIDGLLDRNRRPTP